MYTRCPQCRTVYRISAAQLRRGLGRAICCRCSSVFAALENLADSLPEALTTHPAGPAETPRLNEDAAIPPKNATTGTPLGEASPFGVPAGSVPPVYRRIGVGLLTLLLLFQILYFEGKSLVQKPWLRPLLEGACRHLGCALPPFRDLDSIQVVDRALYPPRTPGGDYEFHLVIVNHAPYPQPCPLLNLTLTALDGTPLVRRVIQPEEYLPQNTPRVMPSHRMLFVHLDLPPPQRPVGGFQIGFLASG